MYLGAIYGFDDLEETGVRAGVNIPVSDSFAMRFDGSLRARDGYITDVISGDDINTRDRWTARGEGLLDLSSNATLRVIVDAAESDEVCCGTTPLIYGSTQAAMSGISGAIVGATGSPAIDVENPLMSVTPSLPGLPAGVNLINAGGSGFGFTAGGPQTGMLSFPAQPGGAARNFGDATTDFGVSAQLDWDIGGINVTSITAYRDWEQTRNQDVDFHSADVAHRYGDVVGVENFTQELRFQGESGRLNWLAGVFYSDETTTNSSHIQVGAHANLFVNLAAFGATTCELFDSTSGNTDFVTDAIPSVFACLGGAPFADFYLEGNTNGQGQQRDLWETNTQSVSVFTHNEISLSDRLILTLGARYTDESKDVSADLLSTSNACTSLQAIEIATDPFIAGPADGVGLVSVLQVSAASSLMNLACNPAVNPVSNGTWAGSSDEGEWSGTGSLAYHVSDDLMIYGGYSRGYKAGGYNLDRQGFSVTPATTSAAGLSIDQTAFDPEFTDAYEIGLKSTILGGTTTLNVTAFYQQIHDYQLNAFNGFNFITRNVPELISQGGELEISTSPIENLTINGGVTYADVYYDSEVRFNPLTAGLGSADPNAVFEGDPLALAPLWTVTGAIAYTMPLGGVNALFYLDARWNDGYRTQTLGRDPMGRTDNDAFAVFNGRVSIGPEDERWSIQLWGQNLFDETYYVGAFAPPLQNSFVVYPNEPRTYGVTLRARY
jgi:outer membrane receptor protein involved in Fe transport